MKILVKEKRILNNFTQEQTARIVDISLYGYQKIENKKSIPNIETVLKLAALFKCNCEDLYKL